METADPAASVPIYRPVVAAAGDEALLLPGFQTQAGVLPLPSPAAAEFGRRQVGAPAQLTARAFERLERTDGCDIRHYLFPA
jgi:hypothetical protein